MRAYTVPGGLLLTFVALLLTDWVSSHQGFEIEGWGTWIGVTLVCGRPASPTARSTTRHRSASEHRTTKGPRPTRSGALRA